MATTPTAGNVDRPTDRTPSRTPAHRLPATSAEPPSSRRAIHTPLDRSAPRDLLNSLRRGTPGSVRRLNNAPTPHAKAARRALNDRRTAMFTPGKRRRRSLMGQREDAMQLLKNLGKALAPKSQPISSSSSSASSASTPATRRTSMRSTRGGTLDDDDDLDDFPIDRPSLTLPLSDLEDEEELRPPRLSGVENEDYTVEFPRRELAPNPYSRLSRGSLGSLQGSDFPNHDPTGEVDMPSDFLGGELDNLRDGATEGPSFQRIDADVTTHSGAEDSFGFEMPIVPEEGTTVLHLDMPVESSPARSLAEATATNVMDAGDSLEDPPPIDDFNSDREPLEDFPDSDDGGLSIADDGFSDRGGELDDMNDGGVDVTTTTAVTSAPERGERATRPLKKRKRISHHGIEYPSLPSTFVKRVAQNALQNSGLSNTRISADTLAALTQASDWFFEQLGDDLEAYASHAKRKTIEESDVVTLMRRQRQVGSNATVFSLAQKHLPRELLQELRMPPPQPVKRRQSKRARDEDDEGEEIT